MNETTPSLSLERWLYEAGKVIPEEDFRDSLQTFLLTQLGEKNETWFLQLVGEFQAEENVVDIKGNIWSSLASAFEQQRPSPSAQFLSTILRHPWFFRILAGTISVFLFFWFFSGVLLGREYHESFVTNIRTAQGEVHLLENGSQQVLEPGQKFSVGQTIKTENGTAEIVFFNDAYLRLGENTALTLEKSIPDPSFPDVGEIDLVLEKGQIWLRTFSDATGEQGVTVKAAELLITPHSAAIDVAHQSTQTNVRVWHRSAQIVDAQKQTNKLFINGEKVKLFAIKNTTVEPISSADDSEPFIRQSQESDLAYRTTRLENIAERYEEESGVLPDSFWYFAKRWLEKANTQNSNEYLHLVEKRFQEGILLPSEQTKLIQRTFLEGIEILKILLEASPEIEPFEKHLFHRFKKDFTALPLASTFQKSRTFLLAAEADLFSGSDVYLHQNILENLWELQSITMEGSRLVPKERFEKYLAQKELLPNPVTESPDEKRALLRIKTQEMKLLNFFFFRIFAEQEIERSEEKVIQEVLALTEGREDITPLLWDPKQFPKGENPVYLFEEKVQIYETDQGRANQVKRLLDEIENDAKNLPFLQEIRKELKENLRPLVTEKIVAVIEAETRKIALKIN